MAQEEALTLLAERFVAAEFVDLDLAPENLHVQLSYCAQRLAHVLRASLHLPSYTFHDRVVAEWPATWWDHLKARLGWRHRTNSVRLRQVLAVPEIPRPLDKYKTVRVVTYLNGGALQS